MAGDCIRLTAVERVKIELGLRDGLSLTAIAAELGRPKGTMSKEIARNGGRDTYDAGAAHIRMENAPRGGRRNRLSPGEPLFEAVACLLPVSYTHLRAHETRHDLVCRLLLEKKKNTT